MYVVTKDILVSDWSVMDKCSGFSDDVTIYDVKWAGWR